jgi:hypothetical protein
MITLSDINDTLLKQNKNLEDVAEDSKSTSKSIQTLVAGISAQIERDERQRLKDTKKRLPSPKVATGNMAKTLKEKYDGGADGLLDGLLRGLGLGGLARGGMRIGAFVAGILTKTLGFIGTGIGKFIKTGVLIGAVSMFGEGVINALFGDKLTEEQKVNMKNALYSTAAWIGLGGKFVTGLLAGIVAFLFPGASEKTGGLITDAFKGALNTVGLPTGWIDQLTEGENGKLIQATIGAMALAMAGRAILLFGGKKILRLLTRRIMTGVGLTSAVKLALDKLLPAGGAPDVPDTGTPSGGSYDPRKGKYAEQEAKSRRRATKKPPVKVPKGVVAVDTPAGPRFRNTATGKFVSAKNVKEAASAINAKKLARMGRLLGVLGLGLEAYRAYEIINNPDLSPKEKTAGLAGVIGSVGGGVVGAALGGVAGTMVFPGVGTLAGGILGGVLGALTGDAVFNAAARWALGIPQDPLPANAVAAVKTTQVNARVSSMRSNDPEIGVRIQPGYEENALDAISADNPYKPKLTSIPSVMLPKIESVIKKPSMTDGEAINELTAYLMQSDYKAEVGRGGAGGFVDQRNITTNNVAGGKTTFVSQTPGTIDILDGGFAIDTRRGLQQ